MLKKLFKTLSFSTAFWLLLGGTGFAMCIGFFPGPSRPLTPANNTKTLVVYQEGEQRLIVQPQFNGRLDDFALVMPAPSLPTVKDAPKDLFDKLEDFTNPEQDFEETSIANDLALESAGSSRDFKAVEVIKREDIGNYTATTIKANDLAKLKEWLQDNGYESNDQKDAVLNYYIKDGGYFVALKVNMSKVDDDQASFEGDAETTEDILLGRPADDFDPWFDQPSALDPIEISYKTESPTLPTRLLAASPSVLDYTVYVLSAEPYVIPGGNTEFAKKLGLQDSIFKDSNVLLSYNPSGQWLTRNKITVDPEKAREDTSLLRIANSGSSVTEFNNVRVNVNRSQWNKNSGITLQQCWIEIEETLPVEPQETIAEDDAQIEEEIFFDEPDFRERQEPCDGHTYDLALDNKIDDSKGAPLKNIGTVGILALFGLTGLWLLNRVRRLGFKHILPNPFKGAWNLLTKLNLINHKHKMSTTALAIRNGVISAIEIPFFVWFMNELVDSRLSNNTIDALGVSALVLVNILIIFVLGSTPTSIAIRKNKKEMLKYYGLLLIFVVIIVLLIKVIVD